MFKGGGFGPALVFGVAAPLLRLGLLGVDCGVDAPLLELEPGPLLGGELAVVAALLCLILDIANVFGLYSGSKQSSTKTENSFRPDFSCFFCQDFLHNFPLVDNVGLLLVRPE